MNKEELKILVDEKIESLKKPFDYGEKYEYFKCFVENNPYTDLKDFLNIDVFKCVACAYAIKDEDYTVEDCKKYIQVLKGLFNSLNCYEILNYKLMLIRISLTYELKNFKSYLTADDNEKEELLTEISKSIKNEKAIETIREIDEKDYPKFYYLVERLQNYPVDVIDEISLIEAQKALQLDYLEYSTKAEKENQEISEKNDSRFFSSKRIKNKYHNTVINNMIKTISTYVDSKDKSAKKHERNIKREIEALNKAYLTLEKQLEQKEITNIDLIINQVKDEDLKLAFLQVIYSHNIEYYNSLENQINELEENSEIKYQALLYEFGISKSEYNVEVIMTNSIEDVRKMLSFLSRLNIDNKQKLAILNSSNLETISTIKTHLNIGYLTIDFININVELLINSSNKYNNYIKNIEELTKYNINPNLFNNSLHILISDNSVLKKNLEVLNKYNLFTTFKDTKSYNFLLIPNLEEKIDKILELGYESFLELDLNILNSPCINRLELIHALNYNISSKEDLDRIIDPDKGFFVDDDHIDEYIPSVIDLKDKKMLNINSKDLEKYKSSIRVYNINGILISINKVNRLLNSGNSMYDSLLYNMKLSNDEYENLIKELTPKVYHI